MISERASTSHFDFCFLFGSFLASAHEKIRSIITLLFYYATKRIKTDVCIIFIVLNGAVNERNWEMKNKITLQFSPTKTDRTRYLVTLLHNNRFDRSKYLPALFWYISYHPITCSYLQIIIQTVGSRLFWFGSRYLP